MAASQRVSRGFHRLLFLCAVCAASQSFAAQITDMQTKFSMLCVAEKGTGFNWERNDWVQSNYKPYSYIVTKVGPQGYAVIVRICRSQFHPLSTPWAKSLGCYELKEVGEKDTPANLCKERWNKTESGYVLLDVNCLGFTNYRAEVDGPFVLTRTYGIFFSGEQRGIRCLCS